MIERRVKMTKIKVGLIGFGRMGEFYLLAMKYSSLWDVVYICDTSSTARELAAKKSPESKIISDESIIFNDPEIQVVGLFTLANLRKEQIEKAIAMGKHIIAEKPLAYSLEDEWKVVDLIERTSLFATVNMYLRNAWYTHKLKEVAQSGEIGELAILRICHMTPGLAPGEGHEYEGPSFHDCGMHYVDIARWLAGSDYKTGHAQAIRMWNYKDPWWLQCHGTFENGVVYDITQGFVYGQLSKDQTHNSYMELIGTKGVVRMTHDFSTAVVDIRGVNITERIERPHGGKNIDRLCDMMANSIMSGVRNENMPYFRDSVIASEYAWRMLEDARKNELPAIGDLKTLEEIHVRRAHMTNGYGLLKKR